VKGHVRIMTVSIFTISINRNADPQA